jgi:ERCC4-type nuclease
MLIKLDNRETDLKTCCDQTLLNGNYSDDIEIQSEVLPLGDAIICENDGTEKIIIERKCLNDLAASIEDGRYAEQGFRLNQCSMHNHNIFYLIEGDFKHYNPRFGRKDKRTLISSMVSISYFKGFSIHKTNSVQESAEWIIQFADKLRRDKGLSFYTGGAETMTNNYSSVSKRVKKDNITVDNIGEIMLSQIPGVSNAAAIAVMNDFKSVKNLIVELENNQHALSKIVTTTKNGKERKLNKTCTSNIYNFLVANAVNCIPVNTTHMV